MKKQDIPPGDEYEIRCPRLGHQIYFSYCLRENGGLPCSRTLHCWHEHFLVEQFLRSHLTAEDWENAFERPGKTKMHSLLEMIAQAKERMEKG